MIKNTRFIQRVGNKANIRKDLFKVICEKNSNHKDLIFVDLFGGGGSMSGYATNFFKKVIYNEISKEVSDLFIAVQNNEFINNLKHKWITRDEFSAIKNKAKTEKLTNEENLILTIWSFGNDRRNYIYGKNIEKRKELTHKICFSNSEEEYKELIKEYNNNKLGFFNKYGGEWCCFLYDNDWEEFNKAQNRRIYKFGANANYYRKFYKKIDLEEIIKARGGHIDRKDTMIIKDLQELENLENLQSLQLVEKLESLQSLQALERLESLQALARLESLQELESLQSLERLERLESLESLQSLERLERLETLESLEFKIEINNKDYREVILPEANSCIIYLDPPYNNTKDYENKFNYDDFIKYVEYLRDEGYTIFLSEYNFNFGEIIFEKLKRGFKNQTKSNYTGKEKLYFIKK